MKRSRFFLCIIWEHIENKILSEFDDLKIQTLRLTFEQKLTLAKAVQADRKRIKSISEKNDLASPKN